MADGGVAVVPSDTLYGVMGSALRAAVVERIYALRQRELDKPMIVLIGDMADLERLGLTIDQRTRDVLGKIWPGPVSTVLAHPASEWAYLHRGKRSLAVRCPAKPELRELLRKTGPLVAPSANLAGAEPAYTIAEAWSYFGDGVDAYVDEGRLEGSASALVDLRTDPLRVLRPAPGFNVRFLQK